MKERLTTNKQKIFARECPTLMSMTKDVLRKHYNEIFDRLQEYEVAEENGNIITPPCKVGNAVYYANGKYYDDIVKCKVIEICQDEKGMTIKTQSWDRCVPGLSERHDRWFKADDFGKKVFLDKEKAREVLKNENINTD